MKTMKTMKKIILCTILMITVLVFSCEELQINPDVKDDVKKKEKEQPVVPDEVVPDKVVPEPETEAEELEILFYLDVLLDEDSEYLMGKSNDFYQTAVDKLDDAIQEFVIVNTVDPVVDNREYYNELVSWRGIAHYNLGNSDEYERDMNFAKLVSDDILDAMMMFEYAKKAKKVGDVDALSIYFIAKSLLDTEYTLALGTIGLIGTNEFKKYLHLRANIYRYLGDIAKSKSDYIMYEALQSIPDIDITDTETTSKKLYNLGNERYNVDKWYDEAIIIYKLVLMFTNSENPKLLFNIYNNLQLSYKQLADTKNQKKYYDLMIGIRDTVYYNANDIQSEGEDLRGALDLYFLSLDLTLPSNLVRMVGIYNGLYLVYRELGEEENAKIFYVLMKDIEGR